MIGILKGKHLKAFLNLKAVVAVCRQKFLLQTMMAGVNVGSRREGFYTMEVTYQKSIYAQQLRGLTFLTSMAVIYCQTDLFVEKRCAKSWPVIFFFPELIKQEHTLSAKLRASESLTLFLENPQIN